MTRRQVQFMESICNGTFNDDREIDHFIEDCAKYSSKRPNKGPESLSKPLNRQEAHNSPAKTKGYFDEMVYLPVVIECAIAN